jgi:C2 domain
MISSLWSSQPESQSLHVALGEKDELTATSLDMQPSCSDSEEPVSLEGILYIRKGRSSGHASWSWKRRFVFFSFEDGGSIAVYKESPDDVANAKAAQQPTSVLRTVYSRIHRSRAYRDESKAAGNLEIDITADLPWIAKDVENDPSFVIEIATSPDSEDLGASLGHTVLTGDTSGTRISAQRDQDFADEDIAFASDDDDDDDDDDSLTIDDGQEGGSVDGKTAVSTTQDDLMDELNIAKSKGKPLRIYFRCDVDTNEKALWLKAFSSFGRLSKDVRKKKSLLRALTSTMNLGSSRIRSIANERIARDTRHLDLVEETFDTDTADLTNDVEFLARGGKGTLKDKEFRVLPNYAYPHRWLTKSEMREEMVLPSERFHDLRLRGCKDKEIGFLKVEVLQCLGLPKLDRGSDTDAVVYLVCGSYAFSTDVIFNRTNPMWLRKTRRACIFPLFHGYARLYVGVFDDEPRRVKDDFAGRVVVDLARLRPRSTYDVTLPLRLSTHVYSRRRRGAVRIRFTLNWTSERDALLSYIPKTFRIPLPQHSKPNFETTVMCSDQKAFRNIAITVHGAHLPGRFTFNQMRAAIREINFTRKYVFTALRQNLRETRQWQNPALSAFVFLSWMHCVYANAFSLVPAYVMLYFLLLLMRNYAKYCTDVPGQRGFIPPSWEELFMALVRGGDPDFYSIEPLELGVRHSTLTRRKSPESIVRSGTDFGPSQYKVTTHKPRGKKLLQALGFFSDIHLNEDYLEFPFADGKDYPKFSVRECLVTHGKPASHTVSGSGPFDDCGSTVTSGIGDGELHRNGVIPRFPLDMDLQRMMRKDSSGTKDFDEEENNFNARRAVMSQGTLQDPVCYRSNAVVHFLNVCVLFPYRSQGRVKNDQDCYRFKLEDGL